MWTRLYQIYLNTIKGYELRIQKIIEWKRSKSPYKNLRWKGDDLKAVKENIEEWEFLILEFNYLDLKMESGPFEDEIIDDKNIKYVELEFMKKM